MVDGTGRIHEAGNDSDLMWAARGGGNGNFGIVTELEFDTVIAPAKLWSYRFRSDKLTAERTAAIAQQWFSLMRDLPKECFSAFVVSGKRLTMLITSTLDTPGPGLDAILSSLGKVSDRRLKDRNDPILPAARRYYGRLQPLYFNNGSAGFYDRYEDISAVAKDIFSIVHQTPGMVFQVNTLGGEINDATNASKGSYAHRSRKFIGEVQTYWDRPDQELQAIQAVSSVQQRLTHIQDHYCNYQYAGLKNAAQSYYGNNYNKLQQIKLSYDPNDRIHHPQSIPLPTKSS